MTGCLSLRRLLSIRWLLLSTIVAVANVASLWADTPQVEVSNVRRVFHNGEHNAFTDMVRFGGRYYLTFRSCPDGHMVHPTASIIVLVSRDLNSWDLVHQFSVRHRDTRDPHFLIFKEKLFIYTGTWYSGATTLDRADYDLNLHLGYAVWSADGTQWSDPIMLDGTFGHYIWRAAAWNDTAYLCGRRKIDFEVGTKGEGRRIESLMLESDDGLIWRKRAVFQPIEGDETAFQFDAAGSITAIGRGFGRKPAQVLRARYPWTDWERAKLDRYIGGPLLVRWGNRWVVGGRKLVDGAKTSMYWLNGNRLDEFAELPAGGDTSYPGFIELSSDLAVMSWYSTHEKDAQGQAITAIYLAGLRIRD